MATEGNAERDDVVSRANSKQVNCCRIGFVFCNLPF
uniref:Uncharacterized protein n=1 Tax=Arundo donax TaxID=35708 RepID=A0A0A8ZTS1_ARUDO